MEALSGKKLILQAVHPQSSRSTMWNHKPRWKFPAKAPWLAFIEIKKQSPTFKVRGESQTKGQWGKKTNINQFRYIWRLFQRQPIEIYMRTNSFVSIYIYLLNITHSSSSSLLLSSPNAPKTAGLGEVCLCCLIPLTWVLL